MLVKCWLVKNLGWSRISSIGAGVWTLLLVKCSQALSNWIKKSSLFCLCKFLCLLDLRICFCLKRARPWLELRIKFNRYSIRSFQRALVGFNNLWVHFIFREFNWVAMSKIVSPPLQMESWAKVLIFKNCLVIVIALLLSIGQNYNQ